MDEEDMFDYTPLKDIIKDNGDHLLTLERELHLTSTFHTLFHEDLNLSSGTIAKLSWYYGVPVRDLMSCDYRVLPCYAPVVFREVETDRPAVTYRPFMDMMAEWRKNQNYRAGIPTYLKGLVGQSTIGRLHSDGSMSMAIIHRICSFLRCYPDYVMGYKDGKS